MCTCGVYVYDVCAWYVCMVVCMSIVRMCVWCVSLCVCGMCVWYAYGVYVRAQCVSVYSRLNIYSRLASNSRSSCLSLQCWDHKHESPCLVTAFKIKKKKNQLKLI